MLNAVALAMKQEMKKLPRPGTETFLAVGNQMHYVNRAPSSNFIQTKLYQCLHQLPNSRPSFCTPIYNGNVLRMPASLIFTSFSLLFWGQRITRVIKNLTATPNLPLVVSYLSLFLLNVLNLQRPVHKCTTRRDLSRKEQEQGGRYE